MFVPKLDDVRLSVRKDTSNEPANIKGSKVAWVDSLTSSSCLYISCPGENRKRKRVVGSGERGMRARSGKRERMK